MKLFSRPFKAIVQNSPYKIFLLCFVILAPTLFFFQNCARMTYEDPTQNLSSNNMVLGNPNNAQNPIGGFIVSGVTGDIDSIVDDILTDGKIPTLQWTEAVNATEYELTIQQGESIICRARHITQKIQRLPDCALNIGTYTIYVTAYGNNTSTQAPAFSFRVLQDIVQVGIQTPQINLRDVKIPYTVTHPENLSQLICNLIDKKTKKQLYSTDCTQLRESAFNNLPYSDYLFSIDVTDTNSQRFTLQKEFSILAPNCNPQNGIADSICEKRIKANIYFHPSEYGDPFWSLSSDYITKGILKGTTYLSQIFIPTQDSDTVGFPGVENRRNFFGLDLTTKLKISNKMPAGNYQLALVVDDGASLYTLNEQGQQTLVINAEGDHPTQLRCSTQALALTSQVNLRLTYFQSRPNALALSLLYRPWKANQNNCTEITDPQFFGPFPVPTNATNWPNSHYQDLLNDGWQPVPVESFENPDL